MSYEERKQRRLRRKKRRNLFVLSIFVLLVARSAYGILVKNPKTVLPKAEEYRDVITAQAVLIMDENLVETNGDLRLESDMEEGMRISKGHKIGVADIVSNIASLNEELEEINRAISILEDRNQDPNIFQGDIESLEASQDELIREIQEKINNKDYSGLEELKAKIAHNDDKLEDVSRENTLLAQSIRSLNDRKNIILEQMNKNKVNYYSQDAGILSFEIDGYEKLYIPREFENYTYDRLQIPEDYEAPLAGGGLDRSLNKFKIINNFDWYLAIKIENPKVLDAHEPGDRLYIKVEDIDRELAGNIVAINKSNKKAVCVVRFNSYLMDYYRLRFPNVEIVLSRQDAYSIPAKSIFDNEGQKGVYIKEFNGIVKFKPVIILGQKGDITYVSKGDDKGQIKIKDDLLANTISLYDEILLNPSSYTEGEILR